MNLKGKTALVTGASKGIGKATAVALAKEGVKVAINYLSDDTKAKEVLNECNRHTAGSLLVKADITNDEQVRNMFLEVKNRFGGFDFLINNAGIFDSTDNPTNLQAFENIWNINFIGQVRVIKHALEILKEGKIVNVFSVHGRLGHGNSHAIAYSALKAGLDSYTKNLAKELAPKILVNAIAPGRTLTPMWGNLSKEQEKELGDEQLIKRFVTADEIADGILFLLKNDAVCGEVLTVDGGMSLSTLG